MGTQSNVDAGFIMFCIFVGINITILQALMFGGALLSQVDSGVTFQQLDCSEEDSGIFGFFTGGLSCLGQIAANLNAAFTLSLRYVGVLAILISGQAIPGMPTVIQWGVTMLQSFLFGYPLIVFIRSLLPI